MNNGPGLCQAGSARRLDRRIVPGPFHGFTVSKSARIRCAEMIARGHAICRARKWAQLCTSGSPRKMPGLVDSCRNGHSPLGPTVNASYQTATNGIHRRSFIALGSSVKSYRLAVEFSKCLGYIYTNQKLGFRGKRLKWRRI